MDDAEAQKQIAQMVSFITNEAQETAQSIKDKTNEDFNIELLKLLQSMKEKIRTDMALMKKKEETRKAIEKSTSINKARLKKIEARQACIEKLGLEVSAKLGEVAKAEAKYKQILIDLIVQGCLKLMEEDVSVKCRAADARVVQSCFAEAQNNYAKIVLKATNVQPKLKLSMDKDTLPANCLGGVTMVCGGGSISVDNTLDTRLRLCMENDKPALRKMMFPN